MSFLSDDAKSILLLCGRFLVNGGVEPLTQSEYNLVVRWLKDQNLRPADLFDQEKLNSLAEATRFTHDRLRALMDRGMQLGLAVEGWNRSGIWVVCRSDPQYPSRYKTHLKDHAPPILFGVGDQALLKGGGVAIVGSRNIDEQTQAFAREAATWCAGGRLPVVSGGARGVDQIAMNAALEAGGVVIGVLADSLLRSSVSRDARYALTDGALLLVSPYHPEAGFTVGNAMARNKLIYAIADYGLVVNAEHEKGGTWAGAVEELGRKVSRPVFVRMNGSVPKGNQKLVSLGAIPCPPLAPNVDCREHMAKAAAAHTGPPGAQTSLLFDDLATSKETPSPHTEAPASTAPDPEPTSKPDAPASIYDAVLPVILNALEKPLPADKLAKLLDVSKTQLVAWLNRAMQEEKISKIGRPVRYVQR